MTTRRERQRAQTLAEIRAHALAQVDEGGAAALSLNAIAKAIGVSGPALYRYFPSRDALLADLVTAGYADLAAAVVAADGDGPEARLRAAVAAYRGWAREHPRRFALLFGLRPAGFHDPEPAIEAIAAAMDVLLALLAALHPDADDAPDAALDAWAARSVRLDPPPPRGVLRRGVALWTRLHGVVALEQSGALADMGLDPGALLDAEVDAALR